MNCFIFSVNSNDNNLTAQVLSIPYEATEAELQTFFEDCNPIRVKIIVDFATQRSKGFGFVTFASQNDLENALQVTIELAILYIKTFQFLKHQCKVLVLNMNTKTFMFYLGMFFFIKKV